MASPVLDSIYFTCHQRSALLKGQKLPKAEKSTRKGGGRQESGLGGTGPGSRAQSEVAQLSDLKEGLCMALSGARARQMAMIGIPRHDPDTQGVCVCLFVQCVHTCVGVCACLCTCAFVYAMCA